MDNFELVKLLMNKQNAEKSTLEKLASTVQVTGTATTDSASGTVMVDMGGDTVSQDETQSVEMSTTISVKKGDIVLVLLTGADGTAKSPMVIGVVGRGDEQQSEIDTAATDADTAKGLANGAISVANNAYSQAYSTSNYFWTDSAGAHVTYTAKDATTGPNALFSSSSLVFRNGETGLMTLDAANNIIALGENSTSSQIQFCGGKANIYFYDNTVKVASATGTIGIALESGIQNITLSNDGNTMLFAGEKVSITDISAPKYYATFNGSMNQVVAAITKALDDTVLSSDETLGYGATVPISDVSGKDITSLAMMRIFYMSNDSVCGSVDVYKPIGKDVILQVIGPVGSANEVYMKSAQYRISSTALTQINANEVHIAGGTVTTDNSSRIKIYRVIGKYDSNGG